MKDKYLIILGSSLLIVSLIFVSVLIQQDNSVNKPPNGKEPSVFVGIDVAYNSLYGLENIVNQVSSYVNLIIIGSTGITYNSSQLNDACQYIYSKGLYFILYTERPRSAKWLQNATANWGNHFLGLYAYDELGGRQLDYDPNFRLVSQAANYTDAANQYEYLLNMSLDSIIRNENSTDIPLFTSDYALYWFDYKSGYDTVFAEFTGNCSRQLNIDLCRGAAESQNKTWGVMITYTGTNPPYIESAPALL